MIKQKMQALSKMIKRKASISGFLSSPSNLRAQPWIGDGNYQTEEVIFDEAVKCVQIERTPTNKAIYWAETDTDKGKLREQMRLDIGLHK